MPIYTLTSGAANLSFVHPHVPKTGGTAVSHFFRTKLDAQMYYGNEMQAIRSLMRCPPQHYHYEILNELFLLDNATISFCVVRNPVTRLMSDYVWAMTKSTMRDRPMSFDDWVSKMFASHARNPYVLANHIRPQYEFIGPKIKNVFKYEDGLDAAIDQVLELAGIRLGRAVVLEKINAQEDPGKGSELSTAMSNATRESIVSFYRKDFENFGYN